MGNCAFLKMYSFVSMVTSESSFQNGIKIHVTVHFKAVSQMETMNVYSQLREREHKCFCRSKVFSPEF